MFVVMTFLVFKIQIHGWCGAQVCGSKILGFVTLTVHSWYLLMAVATIYYPMVAYVVITAQQDTWTP